MPDEFDSSADFEGMPERGDGDFASLQETISAILIDPSAEGDAIIHQVDVLEDWIFAFINSAPFSKVIQRRLEQFLTYIWGMLIAKKDLGIQNIELSISRVEILRNTVVENPKAQRRLKRLRWRFSHLVQESTDLQLLRN